MSSDPWSLERQGEPTKPVRKAVQKRPQLRNGTHTATQTEHILLSEQTP